MKILKKIKSFILIFLYNTPRILFINFYKYCVVRIKVYSPKKIPKNNSAIFAFNHTTGADPIIVLGAIRRKIYFLADSDRFRTRFTDFFFRKFTNSIPVFKKEFAKNIKSFKEAFGISKDKKIFFGIFPEGDLVKSGTFGKFRDGAAYLSYKTKIPIIPVYIHNIHKGPKPGTCCDRNPICEGIYSLFSNMFRRINIFIGDPINPVAEQIYDDLKEIASKNAYKEIIDKITAELEKEFDELKNDAENLAKASKRNNKDALSKGTIRSAKENSPDSEDPESDEAFDDKNLLDNTGNL
jgi:1-acyl-sn-glycerol-3-phosphate acyltransferase